MCIRPESEPCPRDMTWFQTEFLDEIPGFFSGLLFKMGVSYLVEIKRSGLIIQSEKRKVKGKEILEICSDEQKTPAEFTANNGFFESGVWHSTICRNNIKTLESGRSCFRDKTIYFIGDSTVRQWFVELATFLRTSYQKVGRPETWSISRTASDAANNFIMEYRAHGHPLHDPGKRASRPPIAETLSKIHAEDSRDIVVIFNVGAHFVLYDPDFFLDRLAAIRRALNSLKRRIPRVKIFVKGNVRSQDAPFLIPSEWLVYRLDRILRTFFNDITLIDSWSMTTVYPQKSVHADRKLLRHFISLFLSHLCTAPASET